MRSKTKRKISQALVISSLVLTGYLAMAFWQVWWPFARPAADRPNQTIDSAKQQLADSASKVPTDNNNQSSTTTETNPSPSTDHSSKRPDRQQPNYPRQLDITSQGFDQDGNYELRVAANLVAAASAKCELIINQQLIDTVEVQNLPNSSACKGFLINKNKLTKGQNKFQVRFTSGDYTDVVEGEIKGD